MQRKPTLRIWLTTKSSICVAGIDLNEQYKLWDAMVDKHVEKNGGIFERSLVQLGLEFREELGNIIRAWTNRICEF